MTRALRRLGVVGASGRMGRAVVRLAKEAGLELVSAIGTTDLGRDAGELAGVGALGVPVGRDMRALVAARCEVVVDFSTPAGTREAAALAASAGFALVSGTTGLDDDAVGALDRAAEKTAILWEPNMSLGVHVLGVLLRSAVQMLGPRYDIEIVETHHRMKVDAPSGTAMRLAEIARAARADEGTLVHGREGRPGARTTTEIGMHAVRGGDVIGDHTAYLLGPAERIELTHRASSRDLFAHGAVRAAAWLAGKPAGRHHLADVLQG